MSNIITVGRVKGSMWYSGTDFNEIVNPLENDMFINENTGIFYKYTKDNGWVQILDITGDVVDSRFVTVDTEQTVAGLKTFNKEIPKVTITPTDNKHVVNKEYVDSNFFNVEVGKTQFIQSSPTFNKPAKFSDIVTFEKALTIPISPTNSTDAASKGYVDTALSVVQDLQPKTLSKAITNLEGVTTVEDALAQINMTARSGHTGVVSLVNGTIVSKKAERDASNNIITETYATKENFTGLSNKVTQVENTATSALLLAKGAQLALAFNNYEELIEHLNDLENTQTKYNIGQSFYIATQTVPDVWIISKKPLTSEAKQYEYVDDETFVEDLLDGGVQVGYYILVPLETQKVILDDYATKKYVDDSIKNINYTNYATKDYVDETIKEKTFIGTVEQYEAAYASGQIIEGCIVYITDDDDEIVVEPDVPSVDDSTSSILGVGKLGYMILGGN